MRVLLINPQFEFKKFGSWRRFMEPTPCIGLAYIAAVLKMNNIEVEIIDDFIFKLGVPGILSVIKERNIQIVGISCITPSAPAAFSLAAAIKQYNKNIVVVLGNVHASVFSEHILEEKNVDVIVHGEGEYVMLELCKAIAENRDFTDIKGISYKQDGGILRTPARDPIQDLDGLPYPAWHLFPYKRYGCMTFMVLKRPVLTVSGARGCPYHCTFCSIHTIGGKCRIRNPKKIVDEIEYLISNFHVRQVMFIDPIFPLSKRAGLEFCEEMIRRGLNKNIAWACETRVDRVDRELLKAMRQAGCRRILYGVESGTQLLLDAIGKKFTLDSARKAVTYTKKEGIQVAGMFMIGLPGETKEMMQQTIDFAKQIDLDFAKFAITIPFPGSQLYDDLTGTGALKRQDWENFTSFNMNPKELVYVPGTVGPEELIAIQQKGHREFYLRPKIIFTLLFKIRTISIKNLFFGFLYLLSGSNHITKRTSPIRW